MALFLLSRFELEKHVKLQTIDTSYTHTIRQSVTFAKKVVQMNIAILSPITQSLKVAFGGFWNLSKCRKKNQEKNTAVNNGC